MFSLSVLQAQFSIGPGGWVTIKEGSTLMIGSDFHIKSIAGSSGYLVDQTIDGDVTITGNITVDRYLTPDVWHNVASPVSNEASSVYAGTDLVFWYNESLILNDWNFGWVWYYGATGGPLVVFRGYDVLFYTNPVTINYQASGSGTLNTGAYSITVINTSSTPSEIPSHKGWNLAGNPYPSPVDWLASSGWNKASINDAKYIWDGANDIYTIFIGGSSPMGINGGTRFIPSNQGFWVQSVVASGSFEINNATRIGDITGTPDFYKLAPIDYPMVSLLAEGYGHGDEAVVRFIEGTTPGFDINFDASKLYSLNPNVPQLTVRNGKQALALNTLPEITTNLAIDLSFRCAREGLYTIRLAPRTILDDRTRLYLRDDLLGKVINLKADSVYSFYHEPANPENRFKLYFNPYEDVINNVNQDDWFSVYSSGNTITILRNTNRELSGQINICNILGQPIWQQRIGTDDKSIIQLNGPSGYYVVSITTDGYVCNTKVLICN
jgi:hypothetical protein